MARVSVLLVEVLLTDTARHPLHPIEAIPWHDSIGIGRANRRYFFDT
jgi:hypothetical protein